jgi:hypothetical protein
MTMEMLERYLHAVEFGLPKSQRKDIIAELSEDILSEIDENEAKLGRRLNEDELAAILRQHGNPILVASRYAPSRPLIGPALLPHYWFVMKLVLLWILVPTYIFVVGPILIVTSAHSIRRSSKPYGLSSRPRLWRPASLRRCSLC